MTEDEFLAQTAANRKADLLHLFPGATPATPVLPTQVSTAKRARPVVNPPEEDSSQTSDDSISLAKDYADRLSSPNTTPEDVTKLWDDIFNSDDPALKYYTQNALDAKNSAVSYMGTAEQQQKIAETKAKKEAEELAADKGYAAAATGAGALLGAIGASPTVQNALGNPNPLYKPTAPLVPPVATPGPLAPVYPPAPPAFANAPGPVAPVPPLAPIALGKVPVPPEATATSTKATGSGRQFTNYADSMLPEKATGPSAITNEQAARGGSPEELQKIWKSNNELAKIVKEGYPNAVFDPIRQVISPESTTVVHPITGATVALPASRDPKTGNLVPHQHSIDALNAEVAAMQRDQIRQAAIAENEARAARHAANEKMWKEAVARQQELHKRDVVAHQQAEAVRQAAYGQTVASHQALVAAGNAAHQQAVTAHQTQAAINQAAYQQAEAARAAQDAAREQKSTTLSGRAVPMAVTAAVKGLSGLNALGRGTQAANSDIGWKQQLLSGLSSAGSVADLAAPYLKGASALAGKVLSPIGAVAGPISDVYGDIKRGENTSAVVHGGLAVGSGLLSMGSGPFAPLVGPAVYTAGDALWRNRQALAEAAGKMR